MTQKPRISTNTTLKKHGTKIQFPYECHGYVMCPVLNRHVYGYGYGYTIEQAYRNWHESPIPF